MYIPFIVIENVDIFGGLVLPVIVTSADGKRAIEQAEDRICISITDDTVMEAKIRQKLLTKDGSYRVLLETLRRKRIDSMISVDGCAKCLVSDIEYDEQSLITLEAVRRSIIEELQKCANLNLVPLDIAKNASEIECYEEFIDFVVVSLELLKKVRPRLVKCDISLMMHCVLVELRREIAIKKEEDALNGKIQARLGKASREAYLREQLRTIQSELGDEDDSTFDETNDYESQLAKLKLSDDLHARISSEIKKFRMMNAFSAEASVVRSWLECVLSLPWNKKSKKKTSLQKAKEVLDSDHFGLDDVKERILEFLAVQTRMSTNKGQIICLVGPPGIGKTSLAKSIALATGRSFARISLGGVRDESEIRGHRRTYVSAFCGRIISAIKQAGTSNPLILLDEIDKIGEDLRGSPEDALLEVLDPEQNSTFVDHYLEVEYDLSDVMFVATANTLDMSKPLLDRMDIIRLSGYTEKEKVEIAKRYLVDKQKKENGLKSRELSISEDAIVDIIRNYTREAGVRGLERKIAKIARKTVKSISEETCKSVSITSKNLEEYLGVPQFSIDEAKEKDMVGVVTGLAWTEVGGEILSIEAVMYPGKGNITFTGKLGDVMQESIKAAISFIRSKSSEFNIDPSVFEKNDFHIHVPEGATPKDGPSAGIAMVTAICSCVTGSPVRHDVAMTGEITLSGRVLPIGGLKEKILAAHRSGIKTVIIPKENAKDLKKISSDALEALELLMFDDITDVLKVAMRT